MTDRRLSMGRRKAEYGGQCARNVQKGFGGWADTGQVPCGGWPNLHRAHDLQAWFNHQRSRRQPTPGPRNCTWSPGASVFFNVRRFDFNYCATAPLPRSSPASIGKRPDPHALRSRCSALEHPSTVCVGIRIDITAVALRGWRKHRNLLRQDVNLLIICTS